MCFTFYAIDMGYDLRCVMKINQAITPFLLLIAFLLRSLSFFPLRAARNS